MYHNVFRYEYLTFQTQIHFHKQHICETNIIQSEYAFLFSFQYMKDIKQGSNTYISITCKLHAYQNKCT